MRRGGRFVVCSTWDRMSKNHRLGRGVLHGFHCVLLCRSAVCKSAYCIVAATFNIMQCAASCDVMLLVMSVMKTLLHVTMDWNTPSPPTLPPTRPIHTLTKEINKGHLVLYLRSQRGCKQTMHSCDVKWKLQLTMGGDGDGVTQHNAVTILFYHLTLQPNVSEEPGSGPLSCSRLLYR